MRNYNHTIIGAVFTLLIVALFATSCTTEDPCEGSLVLTNPISDVTVAVGDTVYVDLANPPVFVSSKGKVTYSYIELVNGEKTRLNIASNSNDSGKMTLLVISGYISGSVVIELSATSNCLENNTIFNVNVTEQ